MRLNVNKQLEFLQTVNETYWTDLLNEFLIKVYLLILQDVNQFLLFIFFVLIGQVHSSSGCTKY